MKKALYGLKGIVRVKVIFEEKKALVDYQKGSLSERQMTLALEREGYRSEIFHQIKNTKEK